jgi:DNA-binding NarL/FixJ family response regulator
MSLRIFIADDYLLVRQAIKAALLQEGFDVVGEASNGREAIKWCKELKPDVAVLDISMPEISGIEAAREIIRCCPNTRVLMLSDYTADQYVVKSLQAGAKGYVLKADTVATVAEAVNALSKGKTYVSPSVAACLTAEGAGTQFPGSLGVREGWVLRLIAEGKGTKEIADILDITCETVRSHRKHIMKKLDIHDTAGLVRYAINHGLLEAQTAVDFEPCGDSC